MAAMLNRQRERLLLAAVILLTAAAVWRLPAGLPRQVPTFLLLWIWPALTWFRFFPVGHGERSPVTGERALTAAALPLFVQVLLALLINPLPGPVPQGSLLLAATLFALAPLFSSRAVAGRDWQRRRPRLVVALFAVLLLALLLRLPNLGYKELQGDEGVILERAAAALTGDDQELFLHQKGPVEVLLPLTTWSLSGSINEFWARLVFTWAGWLTVAAIMALAWRWFGTGPAIGAGLLFAINGFGIAFARIIQYQSLVLLWGALALLHALRYQRGGRAYDLLLVAVFLAGGLLAHYDAVLVVPAIAWILLRRLRAEANVQWRTWLLSLAVGGLLLALFYIPFALSPTFSSTGQYLLQDRLGGEPLSWSGPQVWRMVTFYNSTYYVLGLLLLGAVGLIELWRSRGPFELVLYLAVPLLFYLFVVADPRTHVYTLFPGAVLLAALGAHVIWQATSTRRQRIGAAGTFVLFLLISTGYVTLLFLGVIPERERTWAENRPALYPTTWEAPPLYGLFGFPHQAGWRVVPDLVEALPYASNVEEEISNWYMAQAARTHCRNFQSFVLAERAQDPVAYDSAALPALNLQYRVTVNGRPGLHVYGREPVNTVRTIEAIGADLWRTPAQVAPPELTGSYPVGATLDGRVRLRGYDLDTSEAYPGGKVVVTLYWEALAPFARNYQTFVHLYDGTLRAQHDGAPECGINPTTRWEPGEIVPDPHIIPLPAELTVESIPVYAGMYDLLSQERLISPTYPDGLIPLQELVLREGTQ